MVVAFLAVAFSPVLLVLGTIQVVRRFAEYAIAKPSREMLFTVVDQESKYKAKNVIDTVVYRFGDVTSAWMSAAVLPYGVAGLAVAGVVMSAMLVPDRVPLGKRYENVRSGEVVGRRAVAVAGRVVQLETMRRTTRDDSDPTRLARPHRGRRRRAWPSIRGCCWRRARSSPRPFRRAANACR